MIESKLEANKLIWEKPQVLVLEISLTEFNCLKLGEFNDLEDANCPRS